MSPDTKLWTLARELGVQVREMLEEEQHFVFSQAKQQFETDPATAELASSTESHAVLDVLVTSEWGTLIGPDPSRYCALIG